MRLFSAFIVLIAARAISCDIWNEDPKKFEAFNVYRFRYEAQALTGIPVTSWQYTGLKLIADVQLFINSSDFSDVILQATDIKYLWLNKELSVETPLAQLPEELFSKLDSQDVELVIQKELSRPVRFSFVDGMVAQLKVSTDEPFWSINLKKGILNMINVDMRPKRGVTARMEWNGDTEYRHYEDGIEGLCKSFYVWERLPFQTPDRSGKSVGLQVTKTRDFDDCQGQTHFDHALFHADDCKQARMNFTKNVISASTHTSLNITYWRTGQFFIWTGETNSQYTFAPLNAKMGSISSFVVQNIKFLSQKKLTDKTEKASPENNENITYKSIKSLQLEMRMTEIADEKEPTDVLRFKVMHVMSQLRQATKFQDLTANSNLLPLINDWLLLLRKCPKKIIFEVFQECVHLASEFPEVLDILEDLLPAIATKDAVNVLIENYVLAPPNLGQNDNMVARRIRSLAAMSNVIHEDLIIELIETTKSSTVTKMTTRRETLKALWLTIGSLGKTYIERQRLRNNTLSGSKITEESLSTYFMEQLNSENIPALTTHEKMVVVLKAIGNAGLKPTFKTLNQIIYEMKDAPLSVRVQAVYAFRKLTLRFPNLVRNILIPLFMDKTQDPELRIAAYIMIIKTQPPMAILQLIGHQVSQESSEQVRSFVLSHMVSFSKNSGLCYAGVGKNISRILETLPTPDFGLQYSQSYKFPVNKERNAFILGNLLWSPDNFLPRTGNVRVMLDLKGEQFDTLEVGFRMEKAQQLFEKLFGPDGTFYKAKSFEELIKQYDENEIEADNGFGVYFKLFDDEIGYWPLDSNLRDLLSQGFLGVKTKYFEMLMKGKPATFNWRKTMYIDSIMRLPTTFGSFFTANLTSIIYSDIKGAINLKQDSRNMKQISLQVKLNPQIVSEHSIKVGMDNNFIFSYSNMNFTVNTPSIKDTMIEITLNPKGSIKIKRNRPVDNWNPLRIQSQLTNQFVNCWNSTCQKHIVIIRPKFVISKAPIKEKGTILDSAPLGLRIRYEKEKDETFSTIRRQPIHYIFGQNRFYNLIVENTDNTNDALELSLDFNATIDSQQGLLFSLSRIPSLSEIESDSNPEEKSDKRSSIGEVYRFTHVGKWEDIKYSHKCVLQGFPVSQGNDFKYTFTGEFEMTHFPKFNSDNPLNVELIKHPSNDLYTYSSRLVNKDNDTLVVWKVVFSMDAEAKSLISGIVQTPEMYTSLSPVLKQCVEDIKTGWKNSLACFSAWRSLHYFNQINENIYITNKVDPAWKTYLASFIQDKLLMLRNHWQRSELQIDNDSVVESEIATYYGSFTGSPFDPRLIGRADLYHNKLHHTLSRILMPRFTEFRFRLADQMIPSITATITNDKYPASCQFRATPDMKAEVTTFDGFGYRLGSVIPPLKDNMVARVILAQDISQRFQIMAIALAPRSQIMRMVGQSVGVVNVIFNNGEVSVRVNDELVTLPYVKKNSENIIILQIMRSNNNIYGVDNLITVDMPVLGVHLHTDIQSIVAIHISPFYHTEVRGVCGDFNGESSNEFKSRDCSKVYWNPEQLYHSTEEYGYRSANPMSLEQALKDTKVIEMVPLKKCLSNNIPIPVNGYLSKEFRPLVQP